MRHYLKTCLLPILFLTSTVYSQNNWDKLNKNIEFAYEFYQWLENYTNKVEDTSDQAEQFHQLLEDIVAKKPSDIMASDVAKPVGEILRDFKKEAKNIEVPDYHMFSITYIALGDNEYSNRRMISDEVRRVLHLNKYFQKLLEIKSSLIDLESRYQQMKEGIRDVQIMFRNNRELLFGLEYDWIAFETTYPNILAEAHTIIRDKRKEYSELERKTQVDLRTAALLVLRNLEEEKIKNQSKKEEYEKLKKLDEEVQASRKILLDLKKQISRNDSLVVVADRQIIDAKSSITTYTNRLKEAKDRRNHIRSSGYVERTYSSCPSGNTWDLCNNVSHAQFKNVHKSNINNEISSLGNSITSYTNLINQREQAIVQEQNKKNEYIQNVVKFRNEYQNKEPPHTIKENELKEKSLQFFESVLNNIIESFFQNNESETLRIRGVLNSIN